MNETINLVHPVMSAGVELRSLSMRRPKVRDQLAVDRDKRSEAEKEVRLFANLCEVAPETIEDLDMADYAKLQETYRVFIGSGRTS
jgi:hypothetical protein